MGLVPSKLPKEDLYPTSIPQIPTEAQLSIPGNVTPTLHPLTLHSPLQHDLPYEEPIPIIGKMNDEGAGCWVLGAEALPSRAHPRTRPSKKG